MTTEKELLTVPDLLRLRADLTPDAVALVDGDDRALTYAQWWRRARAAAAGMRGASAGPGDRVLIALGNRDILAAATTMVAAQLAGACPCLVPGDYAPAETEAARAAVSARFAVTEPGTLTGPGGITALPVSDDAPADAPDDARPGALAQILFTSGSTGRPRPVGATHRQLTGTLAARARTTPDGYGEPGAFVHALPLGTNAAQSMLLMCLTEDEVTHVMPAFHPGRWARLVERHRVQGTLLVPSMAHALVADPDVAARDLSALTNVGMTGGYSSPALLARLAALLPAVEIRNFYTTTEAWPRGVNTLYDPERPEAVGLVDDSAGLRILDAAGADVPRGTVGRVHLRADEEGGRGYLDDTTGGVAIASWIDTGDLGLVDDSGHLVLHGRQSDLIHSGGFKVSPQEVQSVVEACPGVGAAAVVGADHPYLGSMLVAAVVPAGPVDDADIFARCRDRLAPHKLPHRIVRLDSLPLLPSGKVDTAAVRRRCQDRPRPGGGPATPAEATIIDVWRRHLGSDTIDRHSNFFAEGGYSLTALLVVEDLSDALGVDVDVRDLYELASVADLAAACTGRAPRPAPVA